MWAEKKVWDQAYGSFTIVRRVFLEENSSTDGKSSFPQKNYQFEEELTKQWQICIIVFSEKNCEIVYSSTLPLP